MPWANHLIAVELTGAGANAHLAKRNRLAETDHPGLTAYLGEFYGQINAVARGDLEPTLRIVGYMAQLDSAIESAEASEKRLQVFRASPQD